MKNSAMSSARFDVLGIGNAIFDVIAHVDEKFLINEQLIKGSMRLVDATEADRIYQQMDNMISMSGGCAGNTVAGIASLGGSAAYIGKVANDDFGLEYRRDMQGIGAYFETSNLANEDPTARSMILVTPDGERTMNTFLGACVHLTENDIDPKVVADSLITYMEGYLWDPNEAKDAFRKAMKLAHANNRKTAMSLSDSFCVDRYRSEFLHLIQNGDLDIVFANQDEIKSLYQTLNLDSALSAVRQDSKLAVVTMGELGSIVLSGEYHRKVVAKKVSKVVDLTGAGDLFASGFLFALARNLPLDKCAELGSVAAAEVIGQIGPRPKNSLKKIAELNGFSF